MLDNYPGLSYMEIREVKYENIFGSFSWSSNVKSHNPAMSTNFINLFRSKTSSWDQEDLY